MGDYKDIFGMDKVLQMYLDAGKSGLYDERTMEMLSGMLKHSNDLEKECLVEDEDEADDEGVKLLYPKIKKEKEPKYKMVVAECVNNIGIEGRFEIGVEYYCNPNPKGLGGKGIIDVQDMFGEFILLERFRFKVKE